MKKRFTKAISVLMAFLMMVGIVLGGYTPVDAATVSQNNIVARADYLYDSTWVCQKTVAGWRGQYYYYAGNTYRMPYGQPVHAGRYIGYYVSVDDYLAATKNPYSVFYTSRSNCSGMDSVYYATDCSAFVSWCWGISRQTTATIPYYSTYMGMANATNVYNLQLGDCLNSNYIGHVVLVTGLTYNSSGVLTQIEITEQTPPQLKRSYYTPSQLANKYGAYYGIYRYYGTVPAAPNGYTSSSDDSSSGAVNNITTKYFPKCSSSYSTFYAALNSIGVNCDWDLHCRIAELNGIKGFVGTAAQNTSLLDLLKAGKLLNPDYVDTTKYYSKCSSSYETFYAAMDSIGVSCDWDLHCRIAEANGINNFTGTAAQNTQLLNLLKQGKLLIPTESNSSKNDNTQSGTTGTNSGESVNTGTTNTTSVEYYKACSSSYATFYAAMNSIGVSCDWELHCRIAEINGIKDFVGTAAQNTQLLNLLKQGKLIKPMAPAKQFYSACSSSYTTFYAAMDSIGVSCGWDLHCEIAKVNGINNFTGTAAQNTQLLNLLKQGLLINPNGTAGDNDCYAKCSSGYATFYAAMNSIGVSCDWDLHCKIAEVNGIKNFTGTATQNTQLLNLLKAGRLAKSEMPAKQFYASCSSSYTTFYAAMNSIGVSCDWNLHCRIAAVNGITGFTGTAAQNTQLLNLLKQGLLINPDGTVGNNDCYAKCSSSYATFYAAMSSIGISCDWELHCKIAEVNGIKNFTGTATQNTQLLNLLKAGRLVIPAQSNSVDSGNSSSEDTTSDNTSSENTTSGNTSSEDTTSGNTSSEDTTSGNTSSGNTSSGTTSDNSSSGNTTSGNTSSNNTNNSSSEKNIYYPACDSTYATFYAAMDSIGVSCDWELHCEIAEVNGIVEFVGTAAQNTELLNLLKQGKLINPNAEKIVYYKACDSSYTTFYAAMDSIGVSCDWELHCEIAEVNGIADFTGTAAQNTYLLSLLKAGVLIDPTNSVIINTGNTSVVGGGYDEYAGGMAGDGKIYAHGLDLSSWQGSNLDFQNIKNAGYSYVILRAGTSYGKDSCFETYYKRAKAAGLDVGAYYYSYATSTAAAKTDANNMITWLSGKTFEYPIYFDYEDPSQDYLSQTASKNICLTFMDSLAAKGYLVGLYTGYYKSTQLLLSQICEKYEFWVAYYYDNTYTSLGNSFCKRYGMYQYTCTKYVNGAGPFDANVAYKDYPAIVKKYGFNGY